MKDKDIKFFSIRMNKEEWFILRKLKDKHAVNISGSFKIFLKKHLEDLNKIDQKNK